MSETFSLLQKQAAGVPLLALGQTVFWDEPLKACLPILAEQTGHKVSLTAGVHDTDYFAKLPGGVDSRERFVALPKNDGSTKDFWSAAGEFSALFGSETPVRKETLAAAGVSLEKLAHGDHKFIDEATEAWGWRGIASNEPKARVTKEVPINAVFETMQSTFIWALKQTVASLSEPGQQAAAQEMADKLRTASCDTREICPGQTLAEFYECLLPQLHQFTTGRPSTAIITRTSKLFAFDSSTCLLPRFRFVDYFLKPETADVAKEAYDKAVSGTEVYTLDRFGTGAIPFDLVIQNEGRGTIRITEQMLIIMTPEPKFVKLERPIRGIAELADVTEKAFGNCALVGKAITFISMVASEFVLAFHEGASAYVSHTRELNNLLATAGIDFRPNPILRIAHETWDSLCDTSLWFRLPEPLRGPFGAEVVSGPTIGGAWRCVGEQQREALKMLGEARNLTYLIATLHKVKGGRWENLAAEYESLRASLTPLEEKMHRIRDEVEKTYSRLRQIKQNWLNAERERGEHFRSSVLGKSGDDEVHRTRNGFGERIQELRVERRRLRERLRELRAEQAEAAASPEIQRARERRREIEREAELARLRCVQEALMATEGLEKTNRRPSGWWFSVVSPDGTWFNNLLSNVSLRLEPLLGEFAG